jgi:hypothetical protein
MGTVSEMSGIFTPGYFMYKVILMLFCLFIYFFSRDCDIYYRRIKAKKDLEAADEIMQRFNEIDW